MGKRLTCRSQEGKGRGEGEKRDRDKWLNILNVAAVEHAGASGDNVSACHLVGMFTYSLRIVNSCNVFLFSFLSAGETEKKNVNRHSHMMEKSCSAAQYMHI